MYSNYFGLSEPPFAIAPDPRFLYLSDQHREALAHLLYGINSNGGFVLLTGEVGTGKTTVSRCLLEQLPENTEVAFILNPKYSVSELLASICDELGIPQLRSEPQMKDYVDAINRKLLENHRASKHTVLIIDEAQNLSVDVLETIRLLTNLETNTQKLLQIILIGQPELSEKLTRPELRQVNQRITARYHLRALSQDELPAYISHRLSVAGVDCQLFPPATLKRLYKLTKGIPRLINIICDRALLGAYVQRENRVEAGTLGKAADEVLGDASGDSNSSGKRHPLKRVAVAALLVAGVATGVGLSPLRTDISAWAVSNDLWPPEIALATTSVPLPAQPVTAIAPSASPTLTPETPAAQEPVIHSEEVSSGKELSNPANWQWPVGTDTSLTEVQAYKALMEAWGYAYDPRKEPAVCSFAEKKGLLCLFNISNLEELIGLNRPAVIKLFNAKGQNFFATLTAVKGDVATVTLAGEERYVALEDLKLWLVGNYTLFWRKPQYYTTAIQPGVEGPEVIWLDRQLAQHQGRAPRYFRLQTYDSGLVRQVKRFQTSHGLAPDGVVGPHTAIHLNAVSSDDAPVLVARRDGGQ